MPPIFNMQVSKSLGHEISGVLLTEEEGKRKSQRSEKFMLLLVITHSSCWKPIKYQHIHQAHPVSERGKGIYFLLDSLYHLGGDRESAISDDMSYSIPGKNFLKQKEIPILCTFVFLLLLLTDLSLMAISSTTLQYKCKDKANLKEEVYEEQVRRELRCVYIVL